jgi:hypothetical protein
VAFDDITHLNIPTPNALLQTRPSSNPNSHLKDYVLESFKRTSTTATEQPVV